MTTQNLAETRTPDGPSASPLLEAISEVYEHAVAVDRRGRIVWMTDGLADLCGGSEPHVGVDVRTLLPRLPRWESMHGTRADRTAMRDLSGLRVQVPVRNGTAGGTLELSFVPLAEPGATASLVLMIALRVPESGEPARPRCAEIEAAILDAGPDAHLLIDERGFVLRAVGAVERLLGRSPDRIEGRPAALLAGDTHQLERLVGWMGSDAEVVDGDLVLARGDAGRLPVSVSVAPRRDGAGARLWSLRDVSERRQVQGDLERKNAELEHCVHTLSHDLRSPLVALLGFSRLLRQDYGARLDETGAHFLDRIEQAGRTMEDLIHDLLELSRIGRAGERRSLVDPRAVLIQLQGELKPRLDDAGIHLQLPDNPPLVYCDRTRLYQVFSNLIGNAIEHMGECDDPNVEVRVTSEADGHRIAVRDTGRGIDPVHHERIFEVFQSLGSRSDGRRGTGIGLAVVKKIAEVHGGRAWVESRPGQGTTFHVLLPRH